MASIRKRGNSYLLVVSMGYDPEGHRRKPRQKTVHPPEGLTPKAKEKWLEEEAALFERQCKNEPLPVDKSITLAEYTTYWLAHIAPGKLAKSTLARDNYRYRAQMVVQILLFVYVGLTIFFTFMLKFAGMNWFDAVCHSMSACATSGFGTKNTSVAFYDSAMIDMVLIFAMGISGIHFGLIYATVTGKRNNIFRSEVTLFYLGMLILGSLLIALSLYIADIYPTFRSSLRFASFQFVSVTSTSGFATADSSLWTPFAIILLILGSLICACAGSTSGGMKANRALMALKMLYIRVKQQQHPNAVIRLKMDGVIQEAGVLHTVSLFIVAYLLLILIGTILCTLFGVDLMTSFSGCVASIGNVGPGFGGVNSMANYGDLSAIVKFIFTALMLLGRLEIFGLLQFLLIRWWK